MDKNVTISVKGMLVAALALLGLAVAYLLGQGTGTTPTAQAADEQLVAGQPAADRPRTLTMTGTGEARVVPDQVVFDVAVKALRPELSDSLDAANRSMARALRSLGDRGVDERDVETTGLDMYPVYDYPDDQPPVLRGYRVSQTAAVLVKELEQAGGAISSVVESGGNAVRVDGIRLRVGDPEAALTKARASAVAQAQAKAKEYAAAAGQALGDVVTLREVNTEQIRSQISDQSLADSTVANRYSELADVPISTGRSQLDLEVKVVWELAA